MKPFKVAQLSKNRSESYNSNRDEPEEDPEEDAEEDSELELEEDPEEVIEEDLSEEPRENVNDVPSEEDPDEDPSEEDPDEDPSEKAPNKDPSEEDPNEDLSEEDPDEDPLEVCVSQPSSRHDTNLTAHHATEFAYQSKTSKYEDAKPGLVHEAAVEVNHGISGVSKSVGDTEGAFANEDHLKHTEKRRHSRWEQQPQQYSDSSRDGNENGKRRKTRWDSNDSQLKTPDPLQRRKDFVEPELDSVVQGLKVRLIEINSKLNSSEVQDDRPEGERSPSPEPVYNNLGIRVNTREVRFRTKLNQERQHIIAKLIKNNPVSETPAVNKPTKLFKKLYIPVKEYPTYNFVGLILGPRGNTHKRMEKETGAKILLRGKGSGRTPHKADPTDDEDLHVKIEAGDRKSLDAAVVMVEKLLVPQNDQTNDHKLAQLQELAKLKGTYRDENFCMLCKEEGHKTYACPHRPSTLKTISCNTCGSSSHPTSTCPLTASSQASKPQCNSVLNSGPNPSTKSKKEIDESNLYVGCLPQTVSDSRLREMFSPLGKITSSNVVKDQNTGISKGFGFVKFENAMDAATAVMHLNGYHIEGHRLAVRVAGTPPAGTGFSALNPLPLYSRHATIYPGLNQAAWPGPVSMLPAAQVPFLNTVGLVLPHSFTSSGHGNQLPSIGSTNFGFPTLSTHNKSKDASQSFSLPSIGSTNLSSPVISSLNESKGALQSPSSLAQFPGDPDYRSSGFQSYFAMPTL